MSNLVEKSVPKESKALLNGEEDVQNKYYEVLQEQTQNAVKGVINDLVYPIQFPAQGGFLYNWQNLNNIFNRGTYDMLTGNVSPGNISPAAALDTAGSFPNNYIQVLSGVEYSLNKADTITMNKVQGDAQAQQATIVQDYQTAYGTITDAQIDAAKEVVGAWGVATKYDYIISFVLGTQWSGTQSSKKQPLTYNEMSSARNLKDLLPNRPGSSDLTINNVSIYLNMTATVNTLQTQMQDGSWTIAQARRNTSNPTENNGGIKTFNPVDGSIDKDFRTGWKLNKSIADIQNDLNNESRVIEFKMQTSKASGSSLNVSINGSTGFSVGSWLKFSLGTQFSYDMSTFKGTSQDAEITVQYKGYSILPISPLAWQQDINTGWYNGSIIRQAYENQGKDVSGFKFSSSTPPPFDFKSFKDGGNFGWTNNFIVSNYPTIIIKYKNADFNSFKESWSTKTSGNLKLFGFISLGSFSAGASGSSYEKGSNNSEFTLTFSPSQEIISVPTFQKQAFVIAGAITNPGVAGKS
ncbi:hypothetical protein L1276_004932 [Flavobacterium sp. HSC-32F16]|uniref:hypothetical protein n=1 Tax=Flavobacterium sp. HSC-32F16 TaxID=2910964 RepID=UPI0020A5C67A|nr:hypothetical protein [Flavobacterium sp. HSC-32F16]MCP2029738.1 hypothetical protein [Flavobacterium sp. HSC-32F16]